MTAKHTPGPWFICGNERYTKYIEARIDGGLIQEVAACGPTEKQEQQAANAYLIRAAPELLTVAESVMEWWETEQFRTVGDRNVWDGDDEPEMVTKARVALAKAKRP